MDNIINFPTKEEREEKLENEFLESLTKQQSQTFEIIIGKIYEEYNDMCEQLQELHNENKKLKKIIKGLKENAKN
nr:MAG TPA: Herpesvirus BLRF2 protein [Caudoviricetes sp.]